MINNMDANIHKRNLNVMSAEDLQKKSTRCRRWKKQDISFRRKI